MPKKRSQKSTLRKGNSRCEGPGARMSSENLKFSEPRGMGGKTADKSREVGAGQVIQNFTEPVKLGAWD